MRAWIQIFSGSETDGSFDYERPETFNWPVTSIAHHLAMLCRYTGAARRFYSVAEHCCRVALYAVDTVQKYGNPEDAWMAGRAGLVHDVTEMVCGDVNSPLKNMPFMYGYKTYEERLHVAVAKRFNTHKVFVKVNGLDYDVVRNADLQALEFERAQLLGKPPRPWAQSHLLPIVKSAAFTGELGMPWEQAEHSYLEQASILDIK